MTILSTQWKQTQEEASLLLALSARAGSEQGVEIALAAGANLNFEKWHDLYAIHAAASEGHVSILELLLKAGASVDQKSPRSESTPLHFAVDHGRTEAVEFLIKSGAKLNADCREGMCPVHIAARNADKSLFNLLVKHGANPTIAVYGRTADELFTRAQKRLSGEPSFCVTSP